MQRRSISRELTVGLVVLVFLFEGILLLLLYNHQADFLYRDLEAKADEYATNLSETLTVPIWDFDDEQIRRIGEGFVRNKLVDVIQIKDAEGMTLFRFQRSAVSPNRIQRTVPVLHGGQLIGHAAFSLSLDIYRENLEWLRNSMVLALGVSLIVIIITTGFLLRVLMRTPLGILQQGIDRVAQGDYRYRFEKIRHKELAGIANRFQEMATEIHERENSLQQEVAHRKEIEDKIRESSAKIQAIIDAIPDMILHIDREGRVVDFRGDPSGIFPPREKLIGQKLEDFAPKNLQETFRDYIDEVLTTRQLHVFEFDISIRGETFFYECRTTSLSEDQILVILRDITKSVTAAEEKQRLMEQLQRSQKMEAIGMLAGGVAHDLNNVLSGIVSYPELLLLKLPDDSPIRPAIETIQKSGEKASDIVQDLLTLARRGVLVSEVVILNDIIQDYLHSPEFEKLRVHNPNFRLSIDLAEDLMLITGSPIQLSKTVMNLVSNAAEATLEGGQITISTQNRYIDHPIRGYDDVEEGDYVVFQISDNGIGIRAENIDRIFEPFYTKKVMGRSGTGLGMAVVWGTVKDHNGYINVQSAQNEGTIVTLYLPSAGEHRLQEDEIDKEFDLMGSGEHILVVDDVEEQREIAIGILETLGYRVTSVQSGEQAVVLARREAVDLVLLDMIMDPGIDGLETYRQLLQVKPGIKAVITSGFSESKSVRKAQALGAGPYVRKPYRMEAIARAVKEELQRKPEQALKL